MKFEDFHNGLRVLMNIEFDEFQKRVGHDWNSVGLVEDQYQRLVSNPHRYFIQAPDCVVERLFAIITERNAERDQRRAERHSTGEA
jgi:hypothetical protein